jgi:hypothetical protein
LKTLPNYDQNYPTAPASNPIYDDAKMSAVIKTSKKIASLKPNELFKQSTEAGFFKEVSWHLKYDFGVNLTPQEF